MTVSDIYLACKNIAIHDEFRVFDYDGEELYIGTFGKMPEEIEDLEVEYFHTIEGAVIIELEP